MKPRIRFAMLGGLMVGALLGCPEKKGDPDCQGANCNDPADASPGNLDGSVVGQDGSVSGRDGSVVDRDGSVVDQDAGCSPGTAGCRCDNGACASGLGCHSDTCRPPLLCTDIGCDTWNQACVPGQGEEDARCGDCLEGFAADSNDNCLPILACTECAAANRECDETGPDAGIGVCGACVNGFFAADAGCAAVQTCESSVLADGGVTPDWNTICAAEHRTCDAQPSAHCGACSVGYLTDGAICRLPLTCVRDVQCGGNERCVQPASNPAQDAYCTAQCPADAPLGSDNFCHGCPPCTGEGEDGPYLDSLTRNNKCICKTLDGHYWQTDWGTRSCDADGDGWLKISAKTELTNTDDAIRTNARCSLRTVRRIVLEDETGARSAELDAGVLEFYERDVLDDLQLKSTSDGTYLPTYGQGGRELTASELNPLAKYCVTATADFNLNGISDIDESQVNSGVTSWQAGYSRFTYFGELYWGYFVANESDAYHIRERSRSAPPGTGGVAVTYPDEAGSSYWKECSRFQDVAFDGGRQPGMDFAGQVPRSRTADGGLLMRLNTDGGVERFGLGHGSQFKCVKVVATPDGTHENYLTAAELDARNFRLNDCRVEQASGSVIAPGAESVSPQSPDVSCEARVSPPSTGTVAWAAVGFVNTANDGEYQRGCVNECTQFGSTCPGYAANPDDSRMTCDGNSRSFGKLDCGCRINFGGTGCGVVCVDFQNSYAAPAWAGTLDPLSCNPTVQAGDIFVQDGYTLGLRDGFWMCGHAATSLWAPMEEDGGYSLVGAIPFRVGAVETSCEAEDDGGCKSGGYTLNPERMHF